jgi:alpha-tubulin suppressor-like RCC1 family protein
MSVQKYPGRVLSKTPPTITPPVDGEGGSAPGVWTLSEALENQKAGTWPKPALDKELYIWGESNNGRLGLNSIVIDRSSPTQVGALIDWYQVSAGTSHTGAIKTDGTLWTWGNGSNGRLGQNNELSSSSPIQVGALTDWSQVSAGGAFSAAVKTDGTLWTWGDNNYGPLGLNIAQSINVSSPVQVGALADWYQVSAGFINTAAVKTDGTLWTWGNGFHGALGNNDLSSRSSPIQVGSLTNWSQVASSEKHTAAVKTDGTLWTWGYGDPGRLGLNDTARRSSPVQVGSLTNWSQVSTGQEFTAAVKTDGTLWTWGQNNRGQLGQDNTINLSSPVQVGALTNWAQVASSAKSQHIVAVKTDGTLWTWGFGNYGRLGLNNVISRSSPVQVGSLTTWWKASAGAEHTAAITRE